MSSEKSASQKISTVGGFLAGGLAACGAVTFTNPIELIKIRMQLQGELSSNATKVYKNPFQAFVKIYKNEGIRGLQKGLTCAYIYQLGLNGCRLGFYEPSRKAINSIFFPDQDSHKVQNIPVNVAAGAISGIAGAIIGSPLFLVKTRMQSYSDKIAIGDQTHYKNAFDGLYQIAKKEGIRGLFRGVDAAIIRTGMGSSVQLPIYSYVKHFLLRNGFEESPALHLISSTFAGFGVGVVMNPGDVILTRLYNQKGHGHYKGPVDCFIKTVKTEGYGALYKGFFAQLLRIAPHTILTLTFMEQTMKLVQKVETDVLGF